MTAPTDAIAFLEQRASQSKLTSPGPNPSEFERIIEMAIRAPDHGALRPWRFLWVSEENRDVLGDIFRSSLKEQNPFMTSDDLEREHQKVFRAPTIVVCICSPKSQPKFPESEQLLAAGCATYGVVLAASALGFGAIWRTGNLAYDNTVKKKLGLESKESIVGFVYIGTVDATQAPPKSVPRPKAADFYKKL